MIFIGFNAVWTFPIHATCKEENVLDLWYLKCYMNAFLNKSTTLYPTSIVQKASIVSKSDDIVRASFYSWSARDVPLLRQNLTENKNQFRQVQASVCGTKQQLLSRTSFPMLLTASHCVVCVWWTTRHSVWDRKDRKGERRDWPAISKRHVKKWHRDRHH